MVCLKNLRTAAAIWFTVFSFAMLSASAYPDPVTDAKLVTDAFSKAFAACNIPAVLELYEDNAIIIWPGQNDFATGKAAIEKVVKADWNCSKLSKPTLKEISSAAFSVGKNYIIHIGQLDATIMGPDGKPTTLRFRTTELLHKSRGKWRYAVDHASVGIAPHPGTDGSKTPSPETPAPH